MKKRGVAAHTAGKSKKTRTERGPASYENWKAHLRGAIVERSYECPLFTDAHVTGDLPNGYGPYEFLNTVPISARGRLAPAIMLRFAVFDLPENTVSLSETSIERYHGGSLADELAALFALSLGMRLMAAGETRVFDPGQDPRGRPRAILEESIPTLLPSARRDVKLPGMDGSRSLNADALVISLSQLEAASANAVVRSARLYQSAVWVAEADPHLSWLLLVSATESAAAHWRDKKESLTERLEADIPELMPVLERFGGEQLVREVAGILSRRVGATKTFVDFILAFLPEAPAKRPWEWACVDWTPKSIRTAMRTIYSWRSKALHGGTPFPLPMCMAPMRLGDLLAEKPGGAVGGMGGVWLEGDTPMHLHVFEYIVRSALQKWWASVASGVVKSDDD